MKKVVISSFLFLLIVNGQAAAADHWYDAAEFWSGLASVWYDAAQ